MNLEQNMGQDQELFTDYAMQMFSSYQSDDIEGMQNLLMSFSNDGAVEDIVFLPGIVYGMMFHMKAMINMFAEVIGVEPKYLLEKYALGYSIIRDDLLNNPFLNVSEVRKHMDQIKKLLEEVEDLNSIEGLFDN